MARQKRVNWIEQAAKLEQESRDYAREVFSSTNFQLGDSLEAAAPVILAQLQLAWYTGWKAAQEK